MQGSTAKAWDLFQGISILMGFFSMAFGASNLANLFATPKGQIPSAAVSTVAIVLLIGIAIVGGIYLSAFQMIGGAAGLILFGIPLWVRLRSPAI